jgi:hypothetical protein
MRPRLTLAESGPRLVWSPANAGQSAPLSRSQLTGLADPQNPPAARGCPRAHCHSGDCHRDWQCPHWHRNLIPRRRRRPAGPPALSASSRWPRRGAPARGSRTLAGTATAGRSVPGLLASARACALARAGSRPAPERPRPCKQARGLAHSNKPAARGGLRDLHNPGQARRGASARGGPRPRPGEEAGPERKPAAVTRSCPPLQPALQLGASRLRPPHIRTLRIRPQGG